MVEGVKTSRLGGWDRLFWILATNLLNTETRSVQRRAKFSSDKNIADYLFSCLVAWLGRFGLARRLLRWLVGTFGQTAEVDYLFAKHRPDFLFAADVYAPYDVKLMLAAKRRGVKTAAMVRSWDNVTSKTLLMVIPEVMIVNTTRIKEELARYGDVPPRSVSICGIPHYDRYNASGRTSRADFFRKFSLDPAKKLVLFTPPSDGYLKYDPVSPVILKALEKLGVQVLVRLPIVGKADLGDYRPAPGIVFDEPGSSPDFTDVHLSRAADHHLADSIFHSDAVVTWASTMIIDAIVFNKPVVLVGFDAEPRPYEQSITQYYDYDHQRDILKFGGARLARSPDELANLVGKYLHHPEKDNDGRRKVAAEFCGPLDGRSGERLGNFLSGLIYGHTK